MKYLMCNLKSNKTLREILEYKKGLEGVNLKNKEFVLFPSSVYLSFFYDTNYKIGSQNISKYESGNHTGEILAYQLKSLNVSYVLINHCETDETIESCIEKIKNATKKQIKVVFCIGKNTTEIDSNILEKQIKDVFNELTEKERKNCILAYEPCWAINQKEIIDIKILEKTIKKLKEMIKLEYKNNLEFIYGGSINSTNFEKVKKIDILDGYLIGSYANQSENIVKIAEKL